MKAGVRLVLGKERMTPPVAAGPYREFHVGDRVLVRGHTGGTTVWTIVADDTNCSPVHDPEPAYRLWNGRNHRCAYESTLVAAS